MKTDRLVAPWIRTSVTRMEPKRRLNLSFWLIVTVVILFAQLVRLECRIRERHAAYRDLPSADEVMLSSHPDWQQRQAAAIAREYGKIAR